MWMEHILDKTRKLRGQICWNFFCPQYGRWVCINSASFVSLLLRTLLMNLKLRACNSIDQMRQRPKWATSELNQQEPSIGELPCRPRRTRAQPWGCCFLCVKGSVFGWNLGLLGAVFQLGLGGAFQLVLGAILGNFRPILGPFGTVFPCYFWVFFEMVFGSFYRLVWGLFLWALRSWFWMKEKD